VSTLYLDIASSRCSSHQSLSIGTCQYLHCRPTILVAYRLRSSASVYGPKSKRDSVISTVSSSSDASFGCLDKTYSTSSNASVSTAASSRLSTSDVPRPKHRKAFSSSSIGRRFLQKNRPQESKRKSEPAPTSVPAEVPTTPASVAIESPPSLPATDGPCSDIVVRCKSDVYHVDRVIMCYHSRWFARICAVILTPVSLLNPSHPATLTRVEITKRRH